MTNAGEDEGKLLELAAIVQAVKERVRAKYPRHADSNPENAPEAIQVQLADLLPVLHARDAAQAKVAAIGSVNPRPEGLSNRVIQEVKGLISRSLGWFVRDQVTFNREMVSAIEAILEALNDQNRALVSLASQFNGHSARAGAATQALRNDADELKDLREHWIEWRKGWEEKLAGNEIQFLRSVAELQGSFQHRVAQLETNFRDMVRSQHSDYLGALERADLEIQKRLWSDLKQIRSDYERLIHTELRLIRMRSQGANPAQAGAVSARPAASPAALPGVGFDYARFAERFRGPAEYVRRNQELYLPWFQGCESVLDIGCGRGEFLQILRDNGVGGRGIDLSPESVSYCQSQGLRVEVADLFEYLSAQPDEEFDGILSSQVVEHIEPSRLPEMIRLCSAKLRRDGILAIETPNPECLAIFATHFYLDPTHTRPVPSTLLSFYLEEAGMGAIEIRTLSPALDSFPEIGDLPVEFQKRFFGGLDYAIVARKL